LAVFATPSARRHIDAQRNNQVAKAAKLRSLRRQPYQHESVALLDVAQ
jgi:hypothetical protein